MSGLALVCTQLGAEVSGSDRSESSYIERLRAAGLEPAIGHDADQVPEDAEVVVSTAIGEDNPELARARERGQRVLHRGELLAELCAERRLLAVAGTHGKTTTTAMCVHALRETGADPGFFLGGELPGAGPGGEAANAGWGRGSGSSPRPTRATPASSSCEPEVAVITNLELDHHSRWSSLAELTEAFAGFAAPAQGAGVGGGGRAARRRRAATRELIRFALEPADGSGPPRPADLVASGIEAAGRAGSRFHLTGAGIELEVDGSRFPAATTSPTPRRRSAAVALAGADAGRRRRGARGFRGVARRMELKGERDGARIYDDYAHHPTEVRAALEAARELGPAQADRRLPAPPVLADQGAGRGVRRGAGRRRRDRGARGLPGPRGAGRTARGGERPQGRRGRGRARRRPAGLVAARPRARGARAGASGSARATCC